MVLYDFGGFEAAIFDFRFVFVGFGWTKMIPLCYSTIFRRFEADIFVFEWFLNDFEGFRLETHESVLRGPVVGGEKLTSL